MKIRNNASQKKLTPLRAIRAKCLDCCCYQLKEIKDCPILDCSLYKFRMGKNPHGKRKLFTEEQKEQLAKRLNKIVEENS